MTDKQTTALMVAMAKAIRPMEFVLSVRYENSAESWRVRVVRYTGKDAIVFASSPPERIFRDPLDAMLNMLPILCGKELSFRSHTELRRVQQEYDALVGDAAENEVRP